MENGLDQIEDRKKLLRAIFNLVYRKYIKRLFDGPMEMRSSAEQLQNAFIRYIMGQSIIFFQHDHPEAKIYFKLIRKALRRPINLELINNIRGICQKFLQKLVEGNLITPDDKVNYSEVCPLFKPMIIDYDHFDRKVPHDKFVEQILS